MQIELSEKTEGLIVGMGYDLPITESDIADIASKLIKTSDELIATKNELHAACQHVEALCKKRTLYRIVADRARDFVEITSTSNRIALVDALRKLDVEK